MCDRLIELLTDRIPKTDNPLRCVADELVERVADYLLANGVIVPHCKVGDTIYQVIGFNMSEYKVTQIRFDDIMMWFYCENEEYANEHEHFLFDETRIGKTVFLTKEEAEEKLKELGK